MKSSIKKIIAICTLYVVVAVSVLSVGLWGYFKDDNRKLSEMEKIERVLANVGTEIQSNNKTLASSFNKTIEDKLLDQENGKNIADYNKYEGKNYSYIFGEEAFYNAIEKLNVYLERYVCFEYFYKFLGNSFLNKTFNIKTDPESEESNIFSKYTCSYNHINLYVTNPNDNTFDFDDLKATLNFDEETLEPTSLEFVDKITDLSSSVPYTKTRFIYFDFEDKTFVFAQLTIPGSSKISDVKKEEDSEFLKYVYDLKFYYIDFSDYSKFDGYEVSASSGKSLAETGFKDDIKLISEEEQGKFFSKIKGIYFSNLDNFAENFDMENTTPFEKGDEAQKYCQNKYKIEKNETDDNVVYLTIRQIYGIDESVMDAFQVIDDIYNEDYHEFDACSALDFMFNEISYEQKIQIDSKFLTLEDFAAIKNWLDNDYDEKKYYFEDVKINDELLATISNQEISIYKDYGTENAKCIKLYHYLSCWFLKIGQFSNTGFEQFELNFYSYKDSKKITIHHFTTSEKFSDVQGGKESRITLDADLHEQFSYYVSDFQSYYFSKKTEAEHEKFSVSSKADSPSYEKIAGSKDKIYIDIHEYLGM